MLNEILSGGNGNLRIEPEGAELQQQGDPVENGVVPAE